MHYLVWSLPFIIVAVVIGSGRRSTVAGSCGLATSIAVSLLSAPDRFGPLEATLATAQGAWLALLVGAVILGGLFFRDVVAGDAAADDRHPIPTTERRRQLYVTCFLVGPFVEAATGFGIGQVAVAPALKGIGLAPIHAVPLGLFSQTLVPWGALANGTIVGSQLSGLSPSVLGFHSALLTLPLLLGWLGLFWRMAAAAGLPGTIRDFIAEASYTTSAAVLLIIFNIGLGPEVAALAALGTLISLRFVLTQMINRRPWRSALRVGLPYAALIAGLAATRASAPLNKFLSDAFVVRPFIHGASWLPFLHPSTWLFGVAFVAAFTTGRSTLIQDALRRAWSRGKKPVLTIVFFLAMAQVMLSSGIAAALAQGLASTLGPTAVFTVPMFAGLFGFLTSSSSASNGLLMSAQAALAGEAQLSLPWLAAIQNVAAAALTMLSPLRLAMGCALVGRPDLERRVYAYAWPLGAIPLLLLAVAAALLLLCN
ncbi:MAG: L-lactate permease [Sulfurifustis sp.]